MDCAILVHGDGGDPEQQNEGHLQEHVDGVEIEDLAGGVDGDSKGKIDGSLLRTPKLNNLLTHGIVSKTV